MKIQAISKCPNTTLVVQYCTSLGTTIHPYYLIHYYSSFIFFHNYLLILKFSELALHFPASELEKKFRSLQMTVETFNRNQINTENFSLSVL